MIKLMFKDKTLLINIENGKTKFVIVQLRKQTVRMTFDF